ncbi:serine/threonine-protein kinase SMG1 [Pycnococcus provasolii]
MNTALVIAPSGDPSMSHAQAASALLAEWLGDDQQANATSSFSARARAAQKVVAALRETTAKLREQQQQQQQQQQQNREDAATTTILKIFIKNIKTCTPTAPLTPLQDVVMNQVAILVKTLLLEQADYSASEEVLHEFLEATFKYASSRVTRASTIEAFGAFPTDERSAKRIAQSSLTDVEACVRSAAAAVTQTTTNTSACMLAGNGVVENMQRAFASALCLEAPRLPKRTQGDDTTAGSSSSSSSYKRSPQHSFCRKVS